MLDSLLTMTLPLLITLVALPLLARLEVFRSVDKWEKLAVTLSVSTVTLIMALSFWATLLPAGFRAFSLVVYAFGLCSCLWSGYENREFLIVALRGLPRRVRATFRGDKLTLVLWTVIAAYLAKACLFLLFRPIVDADVVDSYLPFARTLYLSDHIPLYNYFDTRPIMVPPVGGWILYGWAYSLSGSMFSESFRLLMLPILIGNLVMTYLLGRTVAGEKTAKLGLIIFAFLPFQDQLLFEFVLYPDMMFAFLSLVVFYLLVQLLYQQREPHEVISYTLIMGLAMGGALLLKFQGVFLYYFLVLFYLLHYPSTRWLRYSLVGVFAIPAIWSLNRFARVGFPAPSPLATAIMAVSSVLFLAWFSRKRQTALKTTAYLASCPAIILVSLPGFAWLIRNQLLFDALSSPLTTETIWTSMVAQATGVSVAGQAPPMEWSLLALPFLGTFWLWSKVLGFWRSVCKEKLALLLLWTGAWYLLALQYLGALTARYLLPALPALALLIAVGVRSLVASLRMVFAEWRICPRRYFTSKTVVAFTLAVVVASLSQSLFLCWNAGIIAYGYAGLHRAVSDPSLGFSSPATPGLEQRSQSTAPAEIADRVRGFLPLGWRRVIGRVTQAVVTSANHLATVLNARGALYSAHTLELLLYGILATPLAMAGALFTIRFGQRGLPRWLRNNLCSSLLLFWILLAPYLLVLQLVSEGDLREFGAQEMRKVYSYWGQSSTIVPYLLEHADTDTVVVVHGARTGLSYYTGLRVLNLEYGYDLANEFRAIFDEENEDRIYQHFLAKRIRYVLVDTHGSSAEHFRALRTMTRMFDLLDNKEYFSLKIEPNDENVWGLYEIVE